MPARAQLGEKSWFIRDDKTEPGEKNSLLAAHLDGTWNRLHIVRIDRIEIGDSGWIAYYRTKPRSTG